MPKEQDRPSVVAGRSSRPRPTPTVLAVVGAVLLVAIGAVLLLPVNDEYHDFWINFDPQGADQHLLAARVTAFMTATSGFLWGHLVALALGTVLARRLGELLRTLTVVTVAATLLAAVNAAVSWQLSAGARQGLAWSAAAAGSAFPVDLLDDRGFLLVLAAGLVAFPIAAVAGVGLSLLITPRPGRLPAVLALLVLAVVPIGGLAATADGEPTALPALLALLPPAVELSAVVRTATGDHGAPFVTAMLVSYPLWALVLLVAGHRAERRRERATGRARTGTGT